MFICQFLPQEPFLNIFYREKVSSNMRYYLHSFVCAGLSFMLTSCTIYTEKRSEALSQAVFATSDSIQSARFDLASQYSKQAEKLAFPPKTRIKINSLYTTTSTPTPKKAQVKDPFVIPPSAVVFDTTPFPEDSILRLVVPEHLKHAKLLIENSEEWNELIRTKEFSIKLQEDHTNLQLLADNVNKELQRQNEMNSKMVSDLKDLQKKLIEKDLAILKRNIIIAVLALSIGGGIYLRMKGIL